MLKVLRVALFHVLRLYVAIEQSRLVRWCRNIQPDLILEPLPTPGSTPEVHDTPSIFLDADNRAAYVHDGTTLRRVALNDEGELVHIRKASKRERKAMKRSTKRHADTYVTA